MSRVNVTIDRIVLRGVDPAHREALVHGLRSELVRLFSEPQPRAEGEGSRYTSTLRLGRVPLEPGHGGHRKLGAGIARAVAKEVTR
jgi:hypothetical protein